MLRHAPPTRRAGFTLIELLIVIAIIAIIAALVTAAIMRTTATANEAGDVNDIKNLEEAVGKFYNKYNCYPPDKVKLCHFLADYNPSDPVYGALDKESIDILQTIWPQVFKLAVSASAPPPNNNPIPWAGFDASAKIIPLPKHPITGQNCVVLEGDQCLVFFLGGLQGTRGFTDSAVLPVHDYALLGSNTLITQKAERFAAYNFPVGRLGCYDPASGAVFPARYNNTPATALDGWMPMDQFPSFLDNFRMSNFVYFSSNMKKGYNYRFSRAIPGFGGVGPYFGAPGPDGKVKYVNPQTFQIICAGVDHLFGPLGGQWDNGVWLNAPAGAPETWKDNHANFFPNRLGSPR
jgi:prepilin-type N-terminal cleavage/methylation domain-containing protein